MAKPTRIATRKLISAEKLDAMHDAGVDLSAHMNYAHAAHFDRDVQRVNVDFPVEVLRAIDAEADRLGVTRQAFIKIRVADSLRAARQEPA